MKAVAQATPYTMSIFKLPTTLYTELELMMTKFWWHNLDGKAGIYWVSWERMCLPKSKGSMGFRCLSHFDKAMVAKQG